ncbi:hypothetical protein BDY21DRAFT_351493 [Lineolata rhizophorae]|uniref:Uncharacterized protein n=1 Tax=Lineolata rhizophorae TaxID=578093 RepID=A0A6A6NTU8_9PEZI|nr:hypothetical protein BDY21DRAFT_351493 [Lineolata rhizophorae]
MGAARELESTGRPPSHDPSEGRNNHRYTELPSPGSQGYASDPYAQQQPHQHQQHQHQSYSVSGNTQPLYDRASSSPPIPVPYAHPSQSELSSYGGPQGDRSPYRPLSTSPVSGREGVEGQQGQQGQVPTEQYGNFDPYEGYWGQTPYEGT